MSGSRPTKAEPRAGLPWTLAEDRLLWHYTERHTPPHRGAYGRQVDYWRPLAVRLGRSPDGVKARWRALRISLRVFSLPTSRKGSVTVHNCQLALSK